MRMPSHLLQASTIRSEPVLAAMAAIAVGMFVGTWVIGPAMTRDKSEVPAQTSQEKVSYEAMVARPDPMPYRAATPAFDTSGAPNYGVAAREKAREVSGSQFVDNNAVTEDQGYSRLPSRSRLPDRHKIY